MSGIKLEFNRKSPPNFFSLEFYPQSFFRRRREKSKYCRYKLDFSPAEGGRKVYEYRLWPPKAAKVGWVGGPKSLGELQLVCIYLSVHKWILHKNTSIPCLQSSFEGRIVNKNPELYLNFSPCNCQLCEVSIVN